MYRFQRHTLHLNLQFSKHDLRTCRKDSDLSRQTAVRGYLWVMKHHRAANLVDYVLRTTHALLIRKKHELDITTKSGNNLETSGSKEIDPNANKGYTFTGFDMRKLALQRQKKLQ